uniref:Dynein regulatory complex protein 1 C-terminal domain-containing protein n=1 Tax=Timema monikensis TaxID=170555 RepID=A0A7R9E3G4_9NEOP|nr:unnamed protein product [Timema monikensis]
MFRRATSPSSDSVYCQILSADRVIHEQLLGLDWYQPGQPLLHKTDLASYRSAMQVVAELFKDKVNQKAVNSPGAHTVQFQDEAGLLRQILQKIADNSGFLVEERLKELLAPYSERERTLIRIDNVFSALNVHSGKDMDLLMTSFLPYCYCSVCDSQDQIALTETEITTYDNSLSRESSEMCVEQMDSGSNTTAATAPVANITTSVHFNENTHAISSQRTIGAKDSCRAANHPLSIDHAYVLKALKDFAAKFYETRFGISLASSLDRKHSTVSRLLTDEDVFMYWSRFLELFDTRHEKLWDGLYLGLKKYQEVLEDRHKLNQQTELLKVQNYRHKLNQQTELLKVQNCELRRLLHTYMMTGSKKTQKPDREFVPPHARRRMVTHMLLFDEP